MNRAKISKYVYYKKNVKSFTLVWISSNAIDNFLPVNISKNCNCMTRVNFSLIKEQIFDKNMQKEP